MGPDETRAKCLVLVMEREGKQPVTRNEGHSTKGIPDAPSRIAQRKSEYNEEDEEHEMIKWRRCVFTRAPRDPISIDNARFEFILKFFSHLCSCQK